MRALLLVSLLAVAVPDRPDRTPPVEKPQDKVLGDWQSIIIDARGTRTIPSVWRFTPAEAIWLDNGNPSPGNGFTATYAIDWTQNPITIDLMPRHGGAKLLGILKFEDDRLTIGLGGKAGGRPSDFGPGTSSQHFTRVKK